MATVHVATPFASFNTWLIQELKNMVAWNPDLVSEFECQRDHQFTFAGKVHWCITIPPVGPIKVTSDERYVNIRQGLRIVMKYARVEVF